MGDWFLLKDTGEEGNAVKLRVGQTIRVGFAFLAISAFWQMYNNIVPLLLTNTFHLNETFSGVIMAMDNVLAFFCFHYSGPYRTNAGIRSEDAGRS